MGASKADNADPIAILTDFGYRDHYVGVMKGVIASITPAARVLDITHGIRAQQITAGALVLRHSWRFFPPRTIFLAVVDPGVGTERLPIAITTRAGARFVGPDNGLMVPAAREAGIKEMVELRSPRHRLAATSTTFHGRDIFAPAAAWIARGTPLRALGPHVPSLTELELEEGIVQAANALTGRVVYIDAFGNLVTNLSRARIAAFAGSVRHDRLSVRLGGRGWLRIGGTYGDVAAGLPLALFGSFGLLEIAVREGDAATVFKAGIGAPVVVKK